METIQAGNKHSEPGLTISGPANALWRVLYAGNLVDLRSCLSIAGVLALLRCNQHLLIDGFPDSSEAESKV